ncbi:MAG: LamG domain-containing protein, partial [archaeon]
MKQKIYLICLALLTILIIPSLSDSAPTQTSTSWQDNFTDIFGIPDDSGTSAYDNITFSGGYAELDRYSGIPWWDANWKYMKIIDISYQSSGSPSLPVPSPSGSDTSLVGYWHFAEGSGPTAKDGSGNGNDGTLKGGASFTAGGKYGPGINLDGNDDYVNVPDDPSISGLSAVTVAAWIKVSSWPAPGSCTGHLPLVCYKFIIDKSNWNETREYRMRYEELSNSIHWHVSSDGSDPGAIEAVIPTSSISVGGWHYLVGTWSNVTGNLSIYLDGILYDSDTYNAAGLYDGTANLSIGSSGNNGSYGTKDDFNGTIDEVRIWNRALTPEEILSNYEEDLDSNLVGSWHLSENVGVTAQDSSANNNEGTLKNGTATCFNTYCPTWTTGKIGTAIHFDG